MSAIYSTSPGEKKDEWEPISPAEIAKLVAESPDLPNTSIDLEDDDDDDDDDDETQTNDDSDESVEDYVSKDIKEEINIIHELFPASGIDQGNDAGGHDDPIKEVMKQVTKSVEPLQRGIEDNIRKLQGVMDEHVQPHLDKVQGVVRPHLETAQVAARQFHRQTSEKWNNLSTSTRNVLDMHVMTGLEAVKKGTVESLESVKKGSVDAFQTSQRALMNLPANSKRTIDERILPAYESVKLGTVNTLEAVSTRGIQTYQTHIQPKIETVHKVHTTYSCCYMGRAPGLFAANETRLHVILTEATLRSFGRVVFCDNPVSGGLIWVAMLVASPIVALCSLSSVVSLHYTVHYLELVPETILRQGDFGINAVLVGAGAAAFFQFGHPWMGWLGSLFMSTIFLPPVTLLVYLHCTRSWLFRATVEAESMPILLIPYNMVMVIFLVTAVLWDRSLVVSAIEEQTTTVSLGVAAMNGVAKVYLVEGVFSGVLVLASTLLCSRILASSLLFGSILATLLGWMFGMPPSVLNAGTAGYNAALTAAALAYYFEPSWTLVIVGVFVVVLCGLFEAAFASFFWDIVGVPITLTLGYCFATMVVMMLDKEESCSRAGVLKRIPENDLSTPEEFLASRRQTTSDDTDDTLPGTYWKTDDEWKVTATESTPLLVTSLIV